MIYHGNYNSVDYLEDQDMSADIEPVWLNISVVNGCCIGVSWTSTDAEGTLECEIGLASYEIVGDSDPDVKISDVWESVTISSGTAPDGLKTVLFDVDDTSANVIRIKYTATSGTGTLQAYAYTKSKG